jgi:hypothetical protein
MFFKGTPSEKKYSQDNFRGIDNFSKIFSLHIFLSNLPSKKGRSNVTYPVRVRVNSEYSMYVYNEYVVTVPGFHLHFLDMTRNRQKGHRLAGREAW